MSDNLRERVEEAIEDARWFDGVHYTIDVEKAAREAIRIVVTALADEAKRDTENDAVMNYKTDALHDTNADWLLSHLEPETDQ